MNRKRRTVNFRSRIMLCFLFSMLLVFLLTGIGVYSKVYNTMEKDLKNLGEFSASQINVSLDIFIDELYRLSNLAMSDIDLLKAVKTGGEASTVSEDYSSNEKICNFLYKINTYRTDTYSVSLTLPSGKHYIQWHSNFTENIDPNDFEPWFRTMMNEKNRYFMILGKRTLKGAMNNAVPSNVFSVARRIVDSSGHFLCALEINVNYSSFLNIFGEAEKKRNARIILEDTEGNEIYRSANAYTDHSQQNGEFYETESISKTTGWKVKVSIPKSQVFGNVYAIMRYAAVIAAISMLCGMIINFIISSTLTKPVHSLLDGMHEVENGDFSVSIPVTSSDEIGMLTTGFNHMTSKMKNLVKKMVDMEIKDKESEYMLLQSQINPHFLYNTLETIRMYCLINREKRIADVINSLGNLFRFSIDHRKKFVPLYEEADHIKAYTAVQNFRFDNKFNLKVNINENFRTCIVPKLILQPIVENSILHALEVKPEGGTIEISCREKNDGLQIDICDDGIGMDSKTLGELRMFLENPGNYPQRKSVGLRNVHERIRIYFGKPYGLDVDSSPGHGTKISILVPLKRTETDEDRNV